jgi:hypothetical protein
MIRALATNYFNSPLQPSTMVYADGICWYDGICLSLLANYGALTTYVITIVDHQNACKTDSSYRLQYHVSVD